MFGNFTTTYLEKKMKYIQFSSSMIKKAIELSTSVALLVTSYFFVQSCLEDFMKGSTYMSKTKQSLEVNHIPTITVCFDTTNKKLKYQQDLNIRSYMFLTDQVQTLTEGENKMSGGNQIRLKQLFTKDKVLGDNCWNIEFEFTVEYFDEILLNTPIFRPMFSMGIFRIDLLTESTRNDSNFNSAYIYITSKQNSYGATLYRWFEGRTKEFFLEKSHYLVLSISTTKYEFLPRACTSMTFYECVASRVNKRKSCCNEYGHSCAPFSLPADKQRMVDLQICQNNSLCWKELQEEDFPRCLNERACSIQEYQKFRANSIYFGSEQDGEKLKRHWKQHPGIRMWKMKEPEMVTLLRDGTHALLFHVKFDTATSSIGEQGQGIKVNVLTERPEWNTIAFIGNIGGQMGLLIGFSFLGTIGWLLDMGERIWQRICVQL